MVLTHLLHFEFVHSRSHHTYFWYFHSYSLIFLWNYLRLILIRRICLCCHRLNFTIIFIDSFLLFFELNCHFLMSSSKDCNVGRLKHFQEIYLISLGDCLYQVVYIYVKKLKIGTFCNDCKVTDVLMRIKQLVSTRFYRYFAEFTFRSFLMFFSMLIFFLLFIFILFLSYRHFWVIFSIRGMIWYNWMDSFTRNQK